MAVKTKSSQVEVAAPSDTKHSVRHHHLTMAAVITASIVALGIVIGCIAWYYQDRALPNVSLGHIDVGGKTKEEIKQIALSLKEATTITFESGDQKVQASLADVGVSIDVEASVNQATWARRNWLDLVLAWERRTVPLAYSNDLGVTKIFVKDKFPNLVTDAKDAQLIFNNQSNSYDIQPGEVGKGFDAVAFVKAVENLARNPGPVNLVVSTSPVQPVVQEDKLEPVKQVANQTKDLPLKFTYKGAVKYTASPAEIASWTHFTPDPLRSSATVSYDIAKVEQFLRNKVGPSIATPAQDKKIVRLADTGREVVVQSGREGRALADVEALSKDIMAALENKTSLEKEVAVAISAFKTVTLSGTDRWIEVDLSEQRTSLYLGADRVATFLISSGIARYPTVTGEFAIRYKTTSQTMTGGSRARGDYYYTPNVTWVSYFYQNYAFHTAYWHNNFGNPMSHGCLNMRVDDAKTLYDFAPVGTRVIVHS